MSTNLVRAMELAGDVGADVVGVVGRDGGTLAQLATASIVIPTDRPERGHAADRRPPGADVAPHRLAPGPVHRDGEVGVDHRRPTRRAEVRSVDRARADRHRARSRGAVAPREHSFGEDWTTSPVDRLGIWLSPRSIRRHAGGSPGRRVGDFGCGYEATLRRDARARGRVR